MFIKNRILVILYILVSYSISYAGLSTITGKVTSNNSVVEFANIYINQLEVGATTDTEGFYKIKNIPIGEYTISASYIGYETVKHTFIVEENSSKISLNFELKETQFLIDQVVVTGTKTFKRQTQSPIIVSVINSKMLENVQACNLSEGLKYQPGLRVETDCQTCNYTQLRMNGLAGGYSQILINGRPIFSPLTGLYGMEQIPANMIERIEVVRGGGSALYGSSAIGGTVNVITKIPKESGFTLGYTYQDINSKATDKILNGNATVLTHSGNAGASFFISNRNREYYDHNGDNFSELPQLKNNSFGTNLFILPTEDQKLELSISSLNEYRYGGEMVKKAAHLALQSEERTHNVFMGSLDYQINFNDNNSSFISYVAGQKTDRDHYTGIFPDDSIAIQHHLTEPPYGISKVVTLQGGVQVNHRLRDFLKGENTLTAGAEFIEDKVLDEIESYNYKIDQRTTNLGLFLQSDWEITSSFNLLTGLRADKHNLLNKFIFSPRVSLLYKLKNSTQFRLTYGTGFRAPQAFDADLHIAFAGGGVSRIILSSDLKEEKSNSLSASVNFDEATEKYIFGFTLEGFYTHLKDAFYQHPIGEDAFGEVFEKRNGDGATVKGITLELRANYDKKVQIETGFNFQSSLFDSPVTYSNELNPKRVFLRTPNTYGYSTVTLTPNDKINASVNMVYTGKMDLLHLAGTPEQIIDEYLQSPSFVELNLKVGYTINSNKLDTAIEVYGGVKNILNAYQKDFDSGKNRDSNFIYGPAAPRTIFVGLQIKSL